MKAIRDLLLLLLVSSLLFSGCLTAAQMAALGPAANYARSPVLDSKPVWRTVVLPASGVSHSSITQSIGLSDYAGMALLRTGRFSLIDRAFVDELLSEQEFSYSGLWVCATNVV